MLGEKSASKNIDSYREALSEWYKWSVLESKVFSNEKMSDLKSKILSARDDAYDVLSKAYKVE